MSGRLRRATLAATLAAGDHPPAAPAYADTSRRAGGRADEGYEAAMQRLVDAAVVASVARGTRATYGVAWRQWSTFCRIRGKSPILLGKTREEILADEEELLLFMVHLYNNLRRAHGTIRTKLLGVRSQHVMMGEADPLQGKPRVWMALNGIERWQGPGQRKLPVTVRMLRRIRSMLDPTGTADDAALYLCIMFGFFFMMRIGEYAHSGSWDYKKVLTGLDIAPKKDGAEAPHFEVADELVLWFKASKADQKGAGQARNHFRSNDPDGICPVWAAACYQRWFPERISGKEAGLPLARWADGSPITRAKIQEVLQRAAVLEGYPPDRFKSHSLRIGGATALYHCFQDTELVKRWGRWNSGAFHIYLWEANEDAAGVSEAMAKSVATLHVGYKATRSGPEAGPGARVQGSGAQRRQ